MALVNGYCSLEELKSEMAISDAVDDALLEAVIEVVSRWVEDWCNRRFYTTAADETRYYTAMRSDRLLLPDDLLTLTSLATDDDGDRTYEDTWAATDYDKCPFNAALDSQPYTSIQVAPDGDYTFPVGMQKGVKLVGKFGYSTTTPAAIKKATLLRATQLFRLKDSPFGSVGGEGMGPIATPVPVWGIVQGLLLPFRRVPVR